MSVKSGYSTPKLFDYSGDLQKDWYVGIRHTCSLCGVRKAYQFRLGINFARTVKERTADGRIGEKTLANALAAGWNPHHEKIEDFLIRKLEPENELAKMLLPEALAFALEKKKPLVKPKSYECFSGAVNNAVFSWKKTSMALKPVSEIKRGDIKILLDQIGKDRQEYYNKKKNGRKWTGNAYNKYKRYLQLLFSELVEFDAAEYNPCAGISDKKEISTNLHRHATVKEEEAIKEYLQDAHPPFFRYLAIMTLLGIRPAELFSLKVSDYDVFNQCFDLEYSDAKTSSTRKIPIPNTAIKYIEELELEKQKPDHYIFSNNFLPGKVIKRSDYAGRYWKELIKDELGIDVTLYSFKGLGGEKKRNAGIAKEAVSRGSFGHASVNTSLIYLHGEDERTRQDIINNTPEF